MVHLRNSYVLQSNMASPFAVQQQQLAFMSQQQALLMAALKAGNSPQIVPGNANQLNTNVSNPPLGTLPFQNWTNLGYQNPGLTLAAAQNGATKVKRLYMYIFFGTIISE
jgi:stromal membrane-associated protein